MFVFIVIGRRTVIGVLICCILVMTLGWALYVVFSAKRPEEINNDHQLVKSVAAMVPVEQQPEPTTEPAPPVQAEPDTKPPQVEIESDRDHLVAGYRLQRQRWHSKRLEILKELCAGAKTDSEQRMQLEQEIVALVKQREREEQLEMLLELEGFDNPLVLMSQGENGEGGSVHVVVCATLDRSQAASIGDLIARVTGISVERVIIIDAMTTGVGDGYPAPVNQATLTTPMAPPVDITFLAHLAGSAYPDWGEPVLP